MLAEKVAETDDDLTEKYLETMELSQEEIEKGLHNAILSGMLTPILFGSASNNVGVAPLLNFINTYGPNPLEGPAIEAVDMEGEPVEVERSEDGPFSALAFKLRVWITTSVDWEEDSDSTRSELAVAIQEALEHAGIGVPFPQRDLHLVSVSPNAAPDLGTAPAPSPRPIPTSAAGDTS